ncbi:SsrA-binding protein [Flavobacterium cyanobacteriorum]|uniref:SsrA-binding protein n=1 Tax=Flavobacterium cyanobacteriorum TaxID=2022802 RepID=A0A255ZQD7_9FLAO|nr:SsrA-binding protein [Flavobacterium cyanobacteriorum]OYQ43629.1 SsrA-binding protein [Flavobacterium cyanobacteriorum]
MFKILAKINRWLLPSYTRQQLDLSKATKLQKAIIAWKYFVTTRALGQKTSGE